MWKLRHLAGVVVMVTLLIGGCASTHEVQSNQATSAWPLDSLAYLYADPIAVSPVNDNPWRWLGFISHPVGVVLDYTVNRPLYSLASAYPSLFGFTPEDAMLHAQRPSRDYGNYE
ncbi:MAG: hypothetical protein C4293_01900 [Nitrospiraceae bacterium]